MIRLYICHCEPGEAIYLLFEIATSQTPRNDGKILFFEK
jgi:hypothetical protein